MNKIAIKRGLPMLACFIGLFLFMKFIGQVQQFNFRILNGVFHVIFIFLAIKELRRENSQQFNYLSGTATGMLTSLVAVIPFAFFIAIYLYLDNELLVYLQENIKGIGYYLTPVGAGIMILMEGLAISLLLSYVITRILARKSEV